MVLTRYDEDLREPLVQCQVSQVSMHVARGSVSWRSSHCRAEAPPHGPRSGRKVSSTTLIKSADDNKPGDAVNSMV